LAVIRHSDRLPPSKMNEVGPWISCRVHLAFTTRPKLDARI
jgi:hypothetical protein